jgi:hypothetical protein
MELGLILVFILLGVALFVGTSLLAILFLLKENERLGEELEKNQPPF